jgi:putative NADH-flavin reductase
MKTIALFGATGKTGKILLRKLTAKGYKIRVLVRNPAKLKITNPLVSVVQGNVLDENAVLKCLEGCDIVINVIGHVKGSPADLQTVAIRNIITGMRKLGITRLIDLTGSGVKVEGDHPKWFDRAVVFIMRNLLGKAVRNRLTDGENHVKSLSKSELEWTIVRAPVLLPGKAKGRTCIGMVGHIPGYSLTYEDLTDQILNITEDKSFVKQYPYITNG